MNRHLALSIVTAMLLTCAVVLAGGAGDGELDPGAAAGAAAGAQDRVVAYYFHGNVRCTTCRKLEAYSKEAIEAGLAQEAAGKRLEWVAVNVDEPDNKHFIHDFQLVTKALVLVEYEGGEIVRWENLKLIWQLVRNKDGFLQYVRDEAAEFIGEG